MKKIVIFLVLSASIISFYISFKNIDNEKLKNIEQLEHKTSIEFKIPSDLILSKPKDFYPILEKTAEECKVNIIRTTIHSNNKKETELIKYILLTKESKLFTHIKLSKGRFITKNDQYTVYLSSKKSNDKNQIGLINDFANNSIIIIKTLKSSYEQMPVDGLYYVETKNKEEYNLFINKLSTNLNKFYKTSYESKDFINTLINNTNNDTYTGTSVVYLKYFNFIIFLATVIIIIYYAFNKSKEIGILKMHGVSNKYIWYIIAGKPIKISFYLILIIIILSLFIIKNTTIAFFYNVIIDQVKTYSIIIIISLVFYLYISKIKINQVIKNRKDTTSIFILNTILKGICSIVLIFIGYSLVNQYYQVNIKKESYKNWIYSNDYGVFYPLEIGYDLDDVKKNLPNLMYSTTDDFYKILNKMGSLFINTRSYEEIALIIDANYKGIRSITVNNNYLQKFPIYDTNNQPIKVNESTSDWILLVPEKYKSKEKEILDFFKKDRISAVDYEKEFLKIDAPKKIKNQNIKIIWLLNNQKIFSFNTEVFKSENNVIIDPIIQVITENNSLHVDRDGILGGGITDPMKVKLINRDAKLTYEKLKEDLKRLKLDDNLPHLITLDHIMNKEIYNLQNEIKDILLEIFILLLDLSFILIQNIIIFFNKYQQRFIIRQLFGLKFFSTYKEYIKLFITSWLIQVIILYLIKKQFNFNMISIILFVILLETSISSIIIYIIEKRSKIKVLKGGY